MDVTSLHKNIPHEDGIKACEEVWETLAVKDPQTQILIKLLSLVLKCNNFELNGKHFLQIQGTAMGTNMAPSYGNIFMGRLERRLLQSGNLKSFPCLRFIDDIVIKWTHDRETLEAFLKTANSFHSTIRFTAKVSDDKQFFLDTVSHLAGDKVAVDLYTKPSDSHQYLLPTSCHPPHCSKNIPYSLVLRVRRICSDDDTFEKRVKDLSEQLKNGVINSR